MKTTLAIAMCAVCGITAPVHAQMTGGSVDLKYSSYPDESDFSTLAFRGQVEYGFNRNAAMQIDIGGYNFGELNETGYNIGLHGLFHASDTVSLGAFYAWDELDGGSADFYGLEAGFDITEDFVAEIYVSTGDNGGTDTDIYGLGLGYEINDQFALNANVDQFDLDSGSDLTRVSLGVEYRTVAAGNYYAELGNLDGEAGGLSDSEAFVGVGVRFDFGADRGATFGQRGFLDKLPGF